LGIVPTELERQGHFSQSLDATGKPIFLKDPLLSGSCTATVKTAYFIGNKIPAARIIAISLKLLPFYPLPNRPGQVNNYFSNANAPDDWDSLLFKVDQRITSKDNVSFRALNTISYYSFGGNDPRRQTGRPPRRYAPAYARSTKENRRGHRAIIEVIRLLSLCALAGLLLAQPQRVRLHISTQAVNSFDPAVAIGAGVDGHEQGEIARMLSPPNVAAMRSAGLKALTYRLRTELAGEAWHWNPEGKWSDAEHAQGYWVSDNTASKPISVSYGYRLPRRGNTKDQANDDNYSRLDDGDRNTFWKSNPYLDRHFTGEEGAAHPPWIVIDLGRSAPVDTLRVLWGEPYATAFRVEHATGSDLEITSNAVWRSFPNANAVQGTGGEQTISLARRPVLARYVRVMMTACSGTAPRGSTDLRDRLGVAIREIYAGTRNTRNGHGLLDRVQHSRSHRQSTMYVSSTDPWHRSTDRDPRIEQPGFDLVFRSGLTNGLPMLTPVPVLYDVPENARNEIRYFQTRTYAVTRVELGEEPEEQHVMPEDYAALYLQWTKALREADPELQTGGPSLVLLPADSEPEPSWTKRMLAWLRAHNALERFQFFTFEWYPYDDVCAPVAPQLAGAPELFSKAVNRLRRDGVSPDMPMFITEYGYSAYGSEAEVTLPGALLNAEIVAQFLTMGGARAYLYGYEPNELINEKACSWGNNMLFLLGENGGIRSRFPAYYAAHLLSQEWAQPSGGIHRIYRADSDNRLVSAFAVHRPDGQWSLLLINKDPHRSFSAQTEFRGSVEVVQYSQIQYAWKSAGENGKVVRDVPPVDTKAAANEAIALPPYSLTVVRGKL